MVVKESTLNETQQQGKWMRDIAPTRVWNTSSVSALSLLVKQNKTTSCLESRT